MKNVFVQILLDEGLFSSRICAKVNSMQEKKIFLQVENAFLFMEKNFAKNFNYGNENPREPVASTTVSFT